MCNFCRYNAQRLLYAVSPHFRELRGLFRGLPLEQEQTPEVVGTKTKYSYGDPLDTKTFPVQTAR